MNNIEKKLDEMKGEVAKVSKIAAELNSVKDKRHIRNLKIIILILSIFFAVSLCINIYFLLAYEKVTETTEEIITTFEGIEQTADNGGNNNIIGGDYNGNAEN